MRWSRRRSVPSGRPASARSFCSPRSCAAINCSNSCMLLRSMVVVSLSVWLLRLCASARPYRTSSPTESTVRPSTLVVCAASPIRPRLGLPLVRSAGFSDTRKGASVWTPPEWDGLSLALAGGGRAAGATALADALVEAPLGALRSANLSQVVLLAPQLRRDQLFQLLHALAVHGRCLLLGLVVEALRLSTSLPYVQSRRIDCAPQHAGCVRRITHPAKAGTAIGPLSWLFRHTKRGVRVDAP